MTDTTFAEGMANIVLNLQTTTANLTAENLRLKAENAELKELRDNVCAALSEGWGCRFDRMADRVREIQAERDALKAEYRHLYESSVNHDFDRMEHPDPEQTDE